MLIAVPGLIAVAESYALGSKEAAQERAGGEDLVAHELE
jgi:hypothetical protein